jgi:hypothetical protein
VVDAVVVHSDGTQIGAVSGLRLHRGDVVRTGARGRAEIRTRGRTVYELPLGSVQLLDGARQVLRQGAVVVDAGGGPGLQLQVAALTVTAPRGAAVRAERSVTLRVGTLAGSAQVQTDTGRQMTVPALAQVVVSGDALPDAPSPLRLTDDEGEAHAAPALVRDDQALLSLATGIDATGPSTVRAVTAAWKQPLESTPVGVARSERVLPVVIAAAGHPQDPTGRYRRAIALRTGGGSWGVVAHRLDTGSGAVLAALELFQKGVATGQVGTIPAALVFVAGHPTHGPGSGGGSTNPPTGGGHSSPSARPTPSPSDTSPTGTVTDTVNRVLRSLPTPTPTSLLPPLSVPSVPVVGGLGAVLPTPSHP